VSKLLHELRLHLVMRVQKQRIRKFAGVRLAEGSGILATGYAKVP
jgi:hypothetical protein